MRITSILILLMVLGCLGGGKIQSSTTTAPQTQPPTTLTPSEMSATGKILFEEKCPLCHSLDRPASKRKSYDEWLSTVLRMKNQNGAPITDEEAKIIAEYLAATYGK